MTFTRAFIDAMKRWAPLCGLGYVQGWKAAERSKVYGHERAVGYLTKYLSSKDPPEFLHTIRGPVVTVTRSLTRRTGVTMVALRKARRLWSARAGRCPMPDWSPDDSSLSPSYWIAKLHLRGHRDRLRGGVGSPKGTPPRVQAGSDRFEESDCRAIKPCSHPNPYRNFCTWLFEA